MKPKLLLVLALVLSGGLVGCFNIASVNETNATQSYVTASVKTNWTNAKVALYRTTGGKVQLDAKSELVTVCDGPYTNDWEVLAFVDPETGNAWVGSGFDFGQMFYLETESGIYCGNVYFPGASALGMPRRDIHGVVVGSEVSGLIIWNRSFVASVKHGENVDAAIKQFNKKIDLKTVDRMPEERRFSLGNNLHPVENGLDPWLFQDEGRGSQFKATTIETVDVSNGKVRLDLKNPSGSHKASIWIDLKTWQLVKAIQQ